MPGLPILRCFAFGCLVLAGAVQAAEYDDYLREWAAKSEGYYADWKKNPTDPALTALLLEAGVRADRPEIVDDVAAGGNFLQKEIKLPATLRRVNVRVLADLGEAPKNQNQETAEWVIRRMTPTRFEVWLPTHGWLFDAQGHLLNQAKVPRRDGSGREWYGAFRSDGRWVTTDLWDFDRTLTFFTARGKWHHELTAAQLAPPEPTDFTEVDLLGWGRCDRKGKRWIVSIGSDGGRAIVAVDWQGNSRRLKDPDQPWQLCQRRDLEPKGFFIELHRPSDDDQRSISFSVPGHGTWVGFPNYQWSPQQTEGVHIAGGDHNFGFLPGSWSVFIGASDYALPASGEDQEAAPKRNLKTWFFGPDGHCRGWLRGTYLADVADGSGTCYLDESGAVVVLNRNLRPISRTRYLLHGKQIVPEKLFPDLGLGLFQLDQHLLLVR